MNQKGNDHSGGYDDQGLRMGHDHVQVMQVFECAGQVEMRKDNPSQRRKSESRTIFGLLLLSQEYRHCLMDEIAFWQALYSPSLLGSVSILHCL